MAYYCEYNSNYRNVEIELMRDSPSFGKDTWLNQYEIPICVKVVDQLDSTIDSWICRATRCGVIQCYMESLNVYAIPVCGAIYILYVPEMLFFGDKRSLYCAYMSRNQCFLIRFHLMVRFFYTDITTISSLKQGYSYNNVTDNKVCGSVLYSFVLETYSMIQ